jgi:RNA polymerase sigma-70 factor (ECF subfamily)
VFRTHYDPLVRFAYGYVRSQAVAEEMVQDLFLKMWEQRGTWELHGSLKSYLYTAVRNSALNDLRHRRIRQELEGRSAREGTALGMGEHTPRADRVLEEEEQTLALRNAVDALPEIYRTVIALRAQHGLSYLEIAAVLGLPVRTVETRIARGMRALRDRLGRLRP